MHIKKFEGRDLKEALSQIRDQLGPEAVILETSQATASGGVTVLAALPRESNDGVAGRTPALPRRVDTVDPPRRATAPEDAGSRRPAPAKTTITPARFPALETAPRNSASSAGWDGQSASGDWNGRLGGAEWDARGTQAESLAQEAGLRERIQHLGRLVRSDHFSSIPLPLRQLYFDLTDAEVDADLVFQILQRMGSVPLPGQFTPAPSGELLRVLRGFISVGGAVETAQSNRVIALVGPTGVGKTTTTAKIAGQAAFRLGMSVALVSTDAYRVFGAQHLASYAALMGLPFASVSSADEMRGLLTGRFSRVDLVLIDTSGRSPRDPRGIAEIHQLLTAYPDLDVHLVLSATSRARDLALALDAFSLLPVRHLLFTKLDEATTRGGIYTTALKARRPVSYLGTGQEVPDELEPATLEAMTDRLEGGSR